MLEDHSQLPAFASVPDDLSAWQHTDPSGASQRPVRYMIFQSLRDTLRHACDSSEIGEVCQYGHEIVVPVTRNPGPSMS